MCVFHVYVYIIYNVRHPFLISQLLTSAWHSCPGRFSIGTAEPIFVDPPGVLPGAGEGGPSSSPMAAVVALLQGG